MVKRTGIERFLGFFTSAKDGQCWLWHGGKTLDGYGKFNRQTAHRFMWSLCRGPVPKGMLVCHHCDTPACVNPGHLFVGTHKDNMQDMKRKGRGRSGLRKPVADNENYSWPAASIVSKLGGANKVAEIVNVHRTAVYHWMWPRKRGGSGGVIPAKYVEPLIRHAKAQGIRLKPEDFAVRLEQ